MTRPTSQVKADLFKTPTQPARIGVLELLREGERPVGELIPEAGLEASHLSQQLGILRRAGGPCARGAPGVGPATGGALIR